MTSRQRLGWMKMKLLPDYYKTVFLNLILFFIVVQVQFSAFSPTSPHLALPTSLLLPPPLIIVHAPFRIVPAKPSPFSPEIPSPLPSGHCQPVLNVNIFGYILLACLFC